MRQFYLTLFNSKMRKNIYLIINMNQLSKILKPLYVHGDCIVKNTEVNLLTESGFTKREPPDFTNHTL